jgi:hypothetical protein
MLATPSAPEQMVRIQRNPTAKDDNATDDRWHDPTKMFSAAGRDDIAELKQHENHANDIDYRVDEIIP